jgi:hypothetical protein
MVLRRYFPVPVALSIYIGLLQEELDMISAAAGCVAN